MMRLDKFLKVSRLVKRRTLAKQIADSGRVLINDVPAKASTKVKVGDEIIIRFGQTIVTAQVDQLKDSTKKEDAAKMYTIVKEERITEE